MNKIVNWFSIRYKEAYSMKTIKAGYIVIYTPYITRNGKRIYASSYGKKAFRLEIPIDKYRR